MRPDITRIYATCHYTNLRHLTLREFTVPDIARTYGTWHYTNLRVLTLHKFTRADITRIYAACLYTNLRNLALREFKGPDFFQIIRHDITRIYMSGRVNSCNVRYHKFA
jgi:hypothetical protein